MNENLSLTTLFPEEEGKLLKAYLYKLGEGKATHLLRNDIQASFRAFCEETGNEKIYAASSLRAFLDKVQEAMLFDHFRVFQFREAPGKYRLYRIFPETDLVEEIEGREYLDYREQQAGKPGGDIDLKLEIDFAPFHTYGPYVKDPKKVGKGHEVLSGYMTSRFFGASSRWQSHLHSFLGKKFLPERQSIIDTTIIPNEQALYTAVQKAIDFLADKNPKMEIAKTAKLMAGLASFGFKRGLGRTVKRYGDSLKLLENILEQPKEEFLDAFIKRLPFVSRIAIISPHGWFCQENVLGRPDTGGQVVYILDQVKALEKELKHSLKEAGIDAAPKIIVLTRLIPENEGTTSDQPLEKIHGTENCSILRVPFRDEAKAVVPHWISRFHIWPFLEQFALESRDALTREFQGKPDIIVGNYSDGNLVASLLGRWMKRTQCAIAHALEKSKYLFSDMYWEKFEEEYNFSLQFTADLYSMNMADFIIASTRQEIAGTENAMGQYESYALYSLPEIYKVVNGISLYDPKFNVVSPGADETFFYPHTETERRIKGQSESVEELLFTLLDDDTVGHLDDPTKPPLFTMARLDRIKNLTGLVRIYGESPELQEKANLIVVAGTVRSEMTTTQEEREELELMYHLIETCNLKGKIRWIGKRLTKADTGEAYRVVADKRGAFVQPALFEAFGLTVIEAMASGLPVFATQFGGPVEVIEEGKNGFLINPTSATQTSEKLLKFLTKTQKTPAYWNTISQGALRRVENHFTWHLYAEKLLHFSKLYSFWNYTATRAGEKAEIRQYCNLLYHMLYRKRVFDHFHRL